MLKKIYINRQQHIVNVCVGTDRIPDIFIARLQCMNARFFLVPVPYIKQAYDWDIAKPFSVEEYVTMDGIDHKSI